VSQEEGRRYSDEEFRWILERATTERRAPGAGSGAGAVEETGEDAGAHADADAEIEVALHGRAPDGLTLDTIREIAREVGIAEAAVDRAATSLDQAVVVHSSTREAGPWPDMKADFRVARRLTEAEIRMLLLETERVLGVTGTRERTPDGILWRGAQKRIEVEVLRGPDSTLVRGSVNATRNVLSNLALLGALGLGAIAWAWMGSPSLLPVIAPLIIAATGGAMWLYFVGSRPHQEEIRGLLEELRPALAVDEEPSG
jgi:hypothetical protein